MSDNIFYNFACNYNSAMKYLDSRINEKLGEGYLMSNETYHEEVFLYKQIQINGKKKLFKKTNPRIDNNIIEMKDLFKGTTHATAIEEIRNLFNDAINDNEVPDKIVKPFAEFIASYSRYFLVDVDALDNISVRNKDPYTISINITKENTTIKFEFIESAINTPGNNGFKLSNDSPLAFINDTDSNTKIEFINITLSAYDSIVGEYKYVSGQQYNPEIMYDQIGFHYIMSLSKKVIFDTYMDIINKYVYKMSDFYIKNNRNIFIEDL